ALFAIMPVVLGRFRPDLVKLLLLLGGQIQFSAYPARAVMRAVRWRGRLRMSSLQPYGEPGGEGHHETDENECSGHLSSPLCPFENSSAIQRSANSTGSEGVSSCVSGGGITAKMVSLATAAVSRTGAGQVSSAPMSTAAAA